MSRAVGVRARFDQAGLHHGEPGLEHLGRRDAHRLALARGLERDGGEIRKTIAALNHGDYGPALRMFAADATLTFPGRNSWSRQHREPQGGTEQFPTHRGRAEIETFLRQHVDHGIQMEVEDILVNGPPWNTRAAVRVHDWVDTPAGERVYANRAVLFVRSRWGRLVDQEDYEDTARVTEYDALVADRGEAVLSR